MCKKNAASKSSNVRETKQNRFLFLYQITLRICSKIDKKPRPDWIIEQFRDHNCIK